MPTRTDGPADDPQHAPDDLAATVHDPARLAAVRATNLLDAAAEPAFDRLTRLAVRLVGVPAAFFSLVDATRDFYASACGFGEPLASTRELRGPTFCHYAIQSRTPLVIPDTAADPVYRNVPTVRTLGVAAYVGVPIVVDDEVIGSFCVIDTAPRAWTAGDVEVLVELAASAEREIGLRSAVVEAERLAAQLQEQATELELQAEELQMTAAHLEQRTEQAEAAAEERQRLLSATETARRHAEAQQQQADAARRRAETAQREAEVATRAKSEFLATMSHEIRTPINAVLGYADLLSLGVGGPLTGQQRDYLDRLIASGRHLLGLVNEVLDTARVESGRMTVARERGDLATVAEAALALVRPQAAACGLRLDLHYEVPDGTVFFGDETRVRQIIVNLLANAVKFTDPVVVANGTPHEPERGPERGPARAAVVAMTCGAATADDCPPGTDPATAASWLLVRVADTGIGIPADQLEAVFEPFVQVDQGHTRTRGGSGLGLAISRRLARLMGGDLIAQSVPGQGSTFTLWLPAAAVADEAGERLAATTTPLDAGAREALYALGQWLAAHAEAVTATLADRLRHDARIPAARTLAEVDLRDHISTYLVDIAKVLPTAAASDEPTAALQDGSDIQQLISERHGAQRHRLGFTEEMLEREFEIFRDVLAEVVRAEAPGAARPALDRGLAVLRLFLDAAERIARRGLRHAAVATDGA